MKKTGLIFVATLSLSAIAAAIHLRASYSTILNSLTVIPSTLRLLVFNATENQSANQSAKQPETHSSLMLTRDDASPDGTTTSPGAPLLADLPTAPDAGSITEHRDYIKNLEALLESRNAISRLNAGQVSERDREEIGQVLRLLTQARESLIKLRLRETAQKIERFKQTYPSKDRKT